ncbi:MAG: response regulator [Gammaproteobacteria bacterium]|nr:response regulator [Gammaproteobacteria bacterium]
MIVNKKILVADDNSDLADGVAMLLELEGYDVEVAYSGIAAIKKLKEGGFDTAFIDIKMPDASGFDVLRECLHDVTYKIVLMTGFRIEQIIAEINNNQSAVVVKMKAYDHEVFEKADANPNNKIILLAGDGDSIRNCLHEYYPARGKTVCEINKDSACDFKYCDSDVMVLYQKTSVIESLLLLDTILPDIPDHSKVIVVIDMQFKHGECEPSLSDYAVSGCLFKPVDSDLMLAILNESH